MRNIRRRLTTSLAGLAVLGSTLIASAPAGAVETPPYDQVVDVTFPTDPAATFGDDYDSPRSRGAHGATDLMGKKGWGIFAASGGTVTWAPGSDGGAMPSYGYMVRVLGDDGRRYSYVHLNNDTPGTDDGRGGAEHAFAPGVVKGATVSRGQLLGFMGDSGNAEGTGPHLHFEIADDDVVDPDGTHRINPYFSLKDALARGDVPGEAAPAPTPFLAPAPTSDAPTSTVTPAVAPVVDRAPSAFDGSGARLPDDSCPDAAVPAQRFTDVPVGGAHHATVSCSVWWELTRGTTATTYSPARGVTRAQMATFLARLVNAAGGSLPQAPLDQFFDDNDSTHEANIDRMAVVGIMQGVGGGDFDPDATVTRAQMATILVRAYEHASGDTLPAAPDAFTDDDGNPNETRIDQAAAAGFTSGLAPGVFDPGREVTRGQVSSLLVRVLDLAVEDGDAALP